jgi:hypothetical protein
MQPLEFNTHSKELNASPITEQKQFRSLVSHGLPPEQETQPVDRSKFFIDDTELQTVINGLQVLLVDRQQPADTRATLQVPSAILQPGDTLLDTDIQAILDIDEKLGLRLSGLVDVIRSQRAQQAETEDWWSRFASEKHFTHNVFQTDPTEQIIIGRDQIEPVTVYNFGEKLRKNHIEGVVGAVAAMSVLTDGYSRALSPYIVIHDAFTSQHFQHTNTTDQPAARAWLGEPFIEVRRSALDSDTIGSNGQSWVSQLIAHEISHQIDEEVSSNYPDFSRYFHYVDKNGDGLIDYVKPTESFATQYEQQDIDASRPVKSYGYTNSIEDLATVGEEVPFGGNVDQLRKDAYMEVIEAFKQKGAQKYGDMQQLPEDITVEIARGGELQLPVAASLLQPIRIRVENTRTGLINDFFRRILN